MTERMTDSELIEVTTEAFEVIRRRYPTEMRERDLRAVVGVSSNLTPTLNRMLGRERVRGRIEGIRYAMGADMYTGLAHSGSQEIGDVDLTRNLEPPFSLSAVAQEEQAWMGGKLSFPPVEREKE